MPLALLLAACADREDFAEQIDRLKRIYMRMAALQWKELPVAPDGKLDVYRALGSELEPEHVAESS